MVTQKNEVLAASSPTICKEEDAMVSKKPLGGFSCINCQKNLVNVSGMKAHYNSWNKLPYRDPTDWLAKAGQGYSKQIEKSKELTEKLNAFRKKANQSYQSFSKSDDLVDVVTVEEKARALSPWMRETEVKLPEIEKN